MAIDTARSIRSLANSVKAFPHLKLGEALEQIAKEAEQPPMIAVIGEFNAGKSTLLNALIGEALLGMDVLPATAAVTLLKFATERQATLHKCDGSSSRIDLEHLSDYTSQTGASGSRQRASISEVEVTLPCALLRSATLVDTPGFNSRDPAHKETTERFVKRADALVWVFSATHAGSHSQLKQIEDLGTGIKPFAVINRIDELDADIDVNDFIRKRANALSGQTADLVGLSARLALAATSNCDDDLVETSRLPGLKQFLCDDVLTAANRKKRNREAEKLLCVIRQIRISFEQRYTELLRAREEAVRAGQILADTSAHIGAWIDFREEWSAPLDRLINSSHSLRALPQTPNERNISADISAKWEKLVRLRIDLTEIISEARDFSDDSQRIEKERVKIAEEIRTFNKSCLFGRPLFDSAQSWDLAQRRKSWLENALQFKAKVLGDFRRADPLVFSSEIETLQKYLLNFADERIATSRANSQAARRRMNEATADWLALSWNSDAAAQISALLPELVADLRRSGVAHQVIEQASKEIQSLRRNMDCMITVADFPKDIHQKTFLTPSETDPILRPSLPSRIEELGYWRSRVALLNPTLPEISAPLFQRPGSKIAGNNAPIAPIPVPLSCSETRAKVTEKSDPSARAAQPRTPSVLWSFATAVMVLVASVLWYFLYFEPPRLRESADARESAARIADASETAAWEMAGSTNNEEVLNKYLASYPNGIHRLIASHKLRDLLAAKALSQSPALPPVDPQTTVADTAALPLAVSPVKAIVAQSVEGTDPSYLLAAPVDEIKSVLGIWAQSMQSGDLDAQMNCYAPVVDRYFRATNVGEPTLRKWKAAGMAKWTATRFELSEVTFHELEPERFQVEFRKEWDATGVSHFTGASQNTLILKRIGDTWKIVDEQESKVYRVSNVGIQMKGADTVGDPVDGLIKTPTGTGVPSVQEVVSGKNDNDIGRTSRSQ